MGRKPTVTQSEADDVITTLIAAGEYPTHRKVREGLNDRGSPMVLQRYIGEWYRRNGPRLAGNASPAPAGEMDVGIRQQLEQATKAALEQLDAELNRREGKLQAREVALKEHEEFLAGKDMGLQKLVEQLTSDREKDRVAANDAAAALSEMAELAQEHARELTQVRSELAVTEQARLRLEQESAALLDQLEALTGERATAAASLAATQARGAELEGELAAALERQAVLQSELDAARAAQADVEREARRELMTATEKFVELQEAAGEERRAAAAALAEARAAAQERSVAGAALEQQLAQARADAAAATKQRDDVANLFSQQQEAAVATERERGRVDEALASVQAEVAGMRRELAQLGGKGKKSSAP